MSFARFSYAIKCLKNKITFEETVYKNSRNKGNFVTSAFSATAVDRRNPFNYLKNDKNNLENKRRVAEDWLLKTLLILLFNYSGSRTNKEDHFFNIAGIGSTS
jgi:hypothetical protein